VVSKTYAQFCPIAQALDVVGDRWTLLIVRELSFGPRRFTDLRDALPGVAANLLTERLRDLEADGLIAREELPAPAARTVYVLTESGRELRPVLTALARFGTTRLQPVDDDTSISPRAAFASAFSAFFDPLAAIDVDEQYRFVIGGELFEVRVTDGHLRPLNPDALPDLVLTADARTLLAIRQGHIGLDAAISNGRVVVRGSKRTLVHLRKAFALPKG
jgi:DNA-binding HxlR family transcriptional regulator